MEKERPYPVAELLAIAEGEHAERVATLENLRNVTEVRKSYTAVLLWLHGRGAISRDVAADWREIGASSAVRLGQRTVQEAVKFWRRLGILKTTARYDNNGSLIAPLARLDWGAVLAVVTGRPNAAVHEAPRAERVAEAEGRHFLAGPPHSDPSPENPGAESIARGEQFTAATQSAQGQAGKALSTSGGPSARRHTDNGGPSAPCATPSAPCATPSARCARVLTADGGPSAREPLRHGAYARRDWQRVHACAHGLSVSVSDSVVDDGGVRREAPPAAVRALIGEAAALLGINPPGEKMHRLLSAAALAALWFWGRDWLLISARIMGEDMKAGRVRRPTGLLPCILAQQAVAVGGMQTIDDPGVRLSRYNAIMSPIERFAARRYPPPAAPPQQPPAAAAARSRYEVSADERAARQREERGMIAAARNALKAAPSPAPGQGESGDQEKPLEFAGEMQKGGAERQGESEQGEGDFGTGDGETTDPQIPKSPVSKSLVSAAARPP
jgi:hypothetical protein